MLSKSPDVHRLAAQAADELAGSSNPFFEAELVGTEALEYYCRSHLGFQRLAYAQGIAAAAVAAGYSACVEVLLPLVEYLARDSEPEIRNVAVQQICGLGLALHRKDAERSLRDIEASLLVCAQQCALDDEEEVSQAAILAFQQLAELLPTARATAASKRAVDRLEVRGTDDGTLAAVRLLAHTAGSWTPEALRRHVPRYINRWANHRDFSVREGVATCMSLIVKSMPLHLCHQMLLPFFYQLCRDSNWRVRRACSLDLPRLAQAMQQHQEKQQQQQREKQQQHGEHEGEQQQQSSAVPSSSSSSSSTDQPDGGCCTKTSTCLRTIRLSSELSSLSTGNLLSASPAGVHNRNRSSGAVSMQLRSATTAQIMTKHPMHSSLITDSLMHSTTSPANSAPPSPTSSSQPHQSLLHNSSQEEQEQQQAASPGHSTPANAAEASGSGEGQPSCLLEHCFPLLHDCWCALRQCMELLTADSSHWVKVAAMSGLGPFLMLLPGCQVGLLLLGRFTSMAGSTVVIYEISVALACAQHFGPLAVRLGPERWHDMRDAWQALQASRDPAVLCELVHCLPGLVRALGPAITVQELLPALAGLLQSHLGWVAAQLVSVMAELLELLPPSSQDMLLKVLDHLVSPSGERSRSWRLRRDIALQLGRMAAAAGPEAVTDTLWPAGMSLCCDPVAAVRSAAARQVGPLLAALPASLLSCRGEPHGEAGSCSSSSNNSNNSSHNASNCAATEAVAADSPRDVLRCAGRVSFSTSSSKRGSPNKVAQGSDDDTNGEGDDCNSSSQANSTAPELIAAPGSSDSKVSPAANTASAGKPATYGVHFHALASSDVIGSRPCYGMGSSSRPSRTSLDLELDLPSALAPAPAGFSPPCAAAGLEEDCSSRDKRLSPLLLADSSSSSGSSSEATSDSDSGNSSSDNDSEEEEESRSSAPSEAQQQGTAQQHQQQQSPLRQLDAEGSSMSALPQQQQQQSLPSQHRSPAPTIHPAMMPIGHPAMMPVGHPAMMPVGAQRSEPRSTPRSAPRQPAAKGSKSAGDLLKVEAAAQRSKRRHSSTSMPGRTQPAPSLATQNGCIDTGDYDPTMPEPGSAAPWQYMACLLNFFGCSPHHQQRQLFVPLVMGILAACHDRLNCDQATQLLDRLEVLATDAVPGVRYAVAAALQDLKQQAAQLQEKGGEEQSGQQAAKQGSSWLSAAQQAAAANGAAAGVAAGSAAASGGTHAAVAGAVSGLEVPTDSYQRYVKQLAEVTTCSCGPAAADALQQGQPAAAQAARNSSDVSSLAASSGGGVSAGSASHQQGGSGTAAAGAGSGQPSSQGCDACGEAVGDGLEWLVKFSSCQQLERLMGVVALTTGPL